MIYLVSSEQVLFVELVGSGEVFYTEHLLYVMHRPRCFIWMTFNLHKTWRSCYFPPYYESSKMLNNLSKLTELAPRRVTTQEGVFLTTKATRFTKPRLRVNVILNNSTKELRTGPITSKHFFYFNSHYKIHFKWCPVHTMCVSMCVFVCRSCSSNLLDR